MSLVSRAILGSVVYVTSVLCAVCVLGAMFLLLLADPDPYLVGGLICLLFLGVIVGLAYHKIYNLLNDNTTRIVSKKAGLWGKYKQSHETRCVTVLSKELGAWSAGLMAAALGAYTLTLLSHSHRVLLMDAINEGMSFGFTVVAGLLCFVVVLATFFTVFAVLPLSFHLWYKRHEKKRQWYHTLVHSVLIVPMLGFLLLVLTVGELASILVEGFARLSIFYAPSLAWIIPVFVGSVPLHWMWFLFSSARNAASCPGK